MDLLVPPEVGDDGEVDAQKRPSDWLDLGLELKFGEAMYQAMNEFAGVLNADELANLWRVEVEVAVPGLQSR